MINFEYSQPTNVVFGKNTELNVGQYIKPYGKNIMIVYGSERVRDNGLLDTIETSLKENNIAFMHLSGIKPNPVLSKVKEGIKLCKENNIDFILAVGGGSVIDTVKAIAVGTKYPGDVWDIYIEKAHYDQALPLGTVLTIPAAGSECNGGTVITNDELGLKRGIGIQCTTPKFAIMNPELTYSLPRYQTACGCVDIIMHTLERYFTPVQNVMLTDRLCEGLIKTVMFQAFEVLENTNDYDARAEIMWAGTLAHNNLLSTGRIGDWATHDISHELSGRYDLTHGAALAIIFPAWAKYVYETDIDRFVMFAENIMSVDSTVLSKEETVMKGIDEIHDFFTSLGLPGTLTDAGIDDTYFDDMAEKAVLLGDLGHIRKLNKEDIINIYRLAL